MPMVKTEKIFTREYDSFDAPLQGLAVLSLRNFTSTPTPRVVASVFPVACRWDAADGGVWVGK